MTSGPVELSAPAPRRTQRFALLTFAIIASVIYVADQVTKNWVVTTLPENETVPVLGGFLQWHFVRNPGAAFSFASDMTWIFTILSSVVVLVILWLLSKLGSIRWSIFLGLLFGGVLGNLTDRLIREPGFPVGHVIDFISTPWMMPAIYNVADMGVVTGMAVFVLISLLGVNLNGAPRAAGESVTAQHAESSDTTETEGPDGTA